MPGVPRDLHEPEIGSVRGSNRRSRAGASSQARSASGRSGVGRPVIQEATALFSGNTGQFQWLERQRRRNAARPVGAYAVDRAGELRLKHGRQASLRLRLGGAQQIHLAVAAEAVAKLAHDTRTLAHVARTARDARA